MNGRFSSEVIADWVDDLMARDHFLALFAADPYGVSDPLTVEIISEVYARQAPVYVRTAFNLLTLDEVVVWHSLAPGTSVVAIGGFDNEENGTLLYADVLDTPKNFPTGGTYVLPADEWVVGIDVAGG